MDMGRGLGGQLMLGGPMANMGMNMGGGRMGLGGGGMGIGMGAGYGGY